MNENSSAAARMERVGIRYGDRIIFTELDLEIPSGSITMIIGPNGCGKSTALKALSGLMPVSSGIVRIGTDDLATLTPRESATRLALLPQTPLTPEGIVVTDLVSRGRHPHRGRFARWTDHDQAVVDAALRATGTEELADRRVDELSGGQRQRVWIAMTLAQETPLVLFDEPTSSLDIAHQLDVLDLCRTLKDDTGRTFVIVMHDLNLAARYATHLIALSGGALRASGPPESVLTPEVVAATFGITSRLLHDDVFGHAIVSPGERITPG